MARRRRLQPAKLFAGLLSNDPDLLKRTAQLLARAYDAIDLRTEIWDFTATDYYQAEMGDDLQRGFVAFERLISPEALPAIKNETNALEQRIAQEVLSAVPRPVNIDPCYIQLDKVVLATTKDASHRLYLNHGIYGEVTMRFNTGQWEIMPWTYPDYREERVHQFFDQLRENYRAARRAWLSDIPVDELPR